VIKYYNEDIENNLKNKNILISAHGNSIRALCKYLFNLDNNQISKLEIPTGNPLLIKFDNENKILNCEYLDSERAKDLLVY
jgi:2,3-bisphosphoglycerate-dependent phosphoglycerate mutase